MKIWKQSFQKSINFIAQINLKNLKKWVHKNSYVKINDCEKIQLSYQKLTINNLFDEYKFDQYNLMIQKKFTITIKVRIITLFSENI